VRSNGQRERRRVVDLGAGTLGLVDPQQRFLHCILGVVGAAEHPIGAREHPAPELTVLTVLASGAALTEAAPWSEVIDASSHRSHGAGNVVRLPGPTMGQMAGPIREADESRARVASQ
jgi:hypothetical protein